MFANRIKELRTERGMTQIDFAKQFMISSGTIAMWETGKRTPDLDTMKKIAEYFNVTMDYLTGKSKYRNYKEIKDYSWGYTSNEYFEAAFDFCPLLKKIRIEQGFTTKDMSKVLECSENQYIDCEEGIDPISYEKAEKLCSYLGTNVSQVLFDNELYDDPVPEQYHDDVRTWEDMQKMVEIESKNDQFLHDLMQYTPQSMIPIPVVGKVAAGYTCLAETEIIGYELVDRDTILEGYEYMWLKVKGDSMEPMILEGDLVLVRLQRSVNSGEYGVVIVDEEDGLVKRIELGNCKITLISNNPYYPPREFRNEETQRVRIVGKVIESKRKF